MATVIFNSKSMDIDREVYDTKVFDVVISYWYSLGENVLHTDYNVTRDEAFNRHSGDGNLSFDYMECIER